MKHFETLDHMRSKINWKSFTKGINLNIFPFFSPKRIYEYTYVFIYVLRCAIWYHLYNLKNVKNTHEGVLRLVKLQAKSFKLYKWYQIAQRNTYSLALTYVMTSFRSKDVFPNDHISRILQKYFTNLTKATPKRYSSQSVCCWPTF